jgi:hypothetical protein
VEDAAPDAIIIGATSAAEYDVVSRAVDDLEARHPEIPILFGSIAAGGALTGADNGTKMLERIDQAVVAVEEALALRSSAASTAPPSPSRDPESAGPATPRASATSR